MGIYHTTLNTGDTVTAGIWNTAHTIIDGSFGIGAVNIYDESGTLATDYSLHVIGNLEVDGTISGGSITAGVSGIVADAYTIDGEVIFNEGSGVGITVAGQSITFAVSGGQAFDATGYATILPGSLTTAITHGYGGTPDIVVLTPMTDTGGKRWWVDKTSSQFTITIDSVYSSTIIWNWGTA